MDTSTAKHAAEMPPARTHVVVDATGSPESAQVKWFDRLRGFGFLTRGEGTPDIFVHMETLRRHGMTELRPGQWVLVRFGPGPKGLMAAEIRPEGFPFGPASH
jgi:CspA family cold shock protein